MGWRQRVPRHYTVPHVKAMLILSKHGVTYVTEEPFILSEARGDGVVADIYLPQRFLRVECDSEFFHEKRRDEERDKDERLLEVHGIKTTRLDNDRIMSASGEAYVIEKVKEAMKDG